VLKLIFAAFWANEQHITKMQENNNMAFLCTVFIREIGVFVSTAKLGVYCELGIERHQYFALKMLILITFGWQIR
jgi:hypothetical protein